MQVSDFRELYYISHVGNLESILKNGIFSHRLVEDERIDHSQIYDKAIVMARGQRKTPEGTSLWNYANLYFQPRNPMLYRVFLPPVDSPVVVLGIKKEIMSEPGVYICDGNAASGDSHMFPSTEGRKVLPRILRNVDLEYWHDYDGSKREIMAECLVPNKVPPEYIEDIMVPNHETREQVISLVPDKFPIIVSPHTFFRPKRKLAITSLLSIVEGDMFFSRMQTLTVSVNVVGVMGAGVASRAKYQFPDVYVKYQDLCKSKTLKMGRPSFYKREKSTDYELADDPSTLQNANRETCIVLFPTKRDWRENADIKGIEEGLIWLCDHYRSWGVKSLAMPALGCGLGRLNWKDVGPLMCKYLSRLDVEVEVYLPSERKVSDSLLTPEYLLPDETL